MLKLLPILILCLSGFVSASGQTTCPTITVTGPAGVTVPGEQVEYTASVSDNVPKEVKYQWSVSVGKIVGGQGTLRLVVETPKISESNLIATLKVLGLPEGCVDTASETAPMPICILPVLIDQFSGLSLRDQAARLDAAVQSVRENPGQILFIIEYATDRRRQAARVKWLNDQLTRRHKLPPSSFEIITELDGESFTKIYRISPGAERPAP